MSGKIRDIWKPVTYMVLSMGLAWGGEMSLEFKGTREEWAKVAPLAFLDLLQKNPRAVLYLPSAPPYWIARGHVPGLMALLESKTAAGTVCPIASPHIPAKEFQSTVGREAAVMVDAFRRGTKYPGSCSDLAAVDPAELKQWWEEQRVLGSDKDIVALPPDQSRAMDETTKETILNRLDAGDPLSTEEMLAYRRRPSAMQDLIAGLRQGKPERRRNGVNFLTDLGRAMIPAEGVFPERPGPIVIDSMVVSYLVELLADTDREVRRAACVALSSSLVPGELVQKHAATILQHLGRHPSTDGAIRLLGKTKSPEALKLLQADPAFYKSSPGDAAIARARLGDRKAEEAAIAAYAQTADPRAKAQQARQLGYIASDAAARRLAQDIRTPETYIWSGRALRSLRVDIIEGLHQAFPTEPLFWPPPLSPRDDSYYEKIEQWLAANLGVTWKNPRPPFLYQQESPTPPMNPPTP